MSKSLPPPPPPYEMISDDSSAEWQEWYRQLSKLDFNRDEATEYARLFVTNEMDINMIHELNDGVLKSIGIEKAGHRIRILRLQKKNSTSPRASAQPVIQSTVDTPRCAWHPNVAANEKCRKCNRLVCLQCRRERSGDGYVRYYCQNCYDECTIL